MSQHMNMNNLGGMGGPVGGPQMINTGTPGNGQGGSAIDSNRVKLHTYIYDYFLKNGHYDLARSIHERLDVEPAPQQKQSPNQKQVNGGHDAMDADNKDDITGKPDDLPLANVPNASDTSFLFDWWCQFWDCFQAQRGRGTATTKQYLNHVQQQARMASDRQRMMVNPQLQGNMNFRNAMMQNGMGMPNDKMKAAAMQQAAQRGTPQQMQQMQQQYRMQQQQQQMLQQQTQMQREGSSMDINGQQRPQTPGSGENAPSPKRARLDGNGFNGQMGPMGRGQPPNMQGQQVGLPNQLDLQKALVARGIDPNSLTEAQINQMQMQNPGAQAKSMQVYADSMRQQMQQAIDSNGQKGMPNPAGLAQGSPGLDGNGEFFAANQMRGMPGAVPGGPNNNSNHALQDYQMQLMLLEQQNKKRLLMARQEQDSVTNGPGGPMPQGVFPPAMSPSGSRNGPSPNPDEQMKRGTPKMAPGGMPQVNPDGSMAQGRGSPIPGFDPSQMNPNIPPGMYPQMTKMGGALVGPNGQMIPATSHPGFNGQMNGVPTTQQQMEFMRQQQQLAHQNGGRMPPNGAWQGGPPPQMMGGPPGQQPPNMTPRQGNQAMPPPPAPATGETARTQPSSPQQPPAPPTPSQTNKPNPKGKKDAKGNKKAAAKKGGAQTAATPVSEAEQPPTPTPAPPITPTAPAPQFNKNGSGPAPGQQQQQQQQMQQQQQQQQQQPPPGQNMMPGQGGPNDMMNGPFGNLGTNDSFDMNLDFTNLDGGDVLDNFDFDSFLNNDTGDGAFQFDASMAFGGGEGGLEAGGDV